MRGYTEKECKIHGFTTHSILDSGRVKCKKCQCEYQQKHYSSRKAYYVGKAKVRNEFLREFVQRVRRISTCKCGEDRWWVLDFHHRDGLSKIDNVPNLAARGMGIGTIKDEMRKCDILCANCHRDVHYKENNGGVTGVGTSTAS